MKTSTLVALQQCLLLFLLLLLSGPAAVAQPAACGGPDPAGNPSVSGLYAEYYAGYFNDDPAHFTDNAAPPGIRNVVPQVSFTTNASFGDLTAVSTGTALNPDYFSLRLRGTLNILTAGTYTFYLTADDAAFLWLDGPALALPASNAAATINNGQAHGTVEVAATVTLTAGLHSLLVHYGDALSDNVLVLEYDGPGTGGRQVIPNSVLCTALLPAGPPQALSYAPVPATVLGVPVSSAPPVVQNGGAAITQYALAGSVPGGFSIDALTGVVTATAGVALGLYSLDVAATNANGTSIFQNVVGFQVVPAAPAGCTGLDPGGNPVGSGLYAEYYSGYFNDVLTFAAVPPGLTRIDPQLDFGSITSFGNLTGIATGPPADPDNFSARYRGSLRIATAGTYTFYLSADDAAYLWLDNAALDAPPTLATVTINNGGLHAVQTVQATVVLSAGLHNILIYYGENAGNNQLTLEYEGPGGLSRQVIPATAFCTATQRRTGPVSALSYSPRSTTLVAGSTVVAGLSPLPVVTTLAPVTEYALANAAALPAGITIDAATGQISSSTSVPAGTYSFDVTVTNTDGSATFPAAFSFVVALPPPPGCASPTPAGGPPTAGLYGEYFAGYFSDNQSFFTTNTPLLVRTEAQLDFTADNWGGIVPPADGTLLDPDHYSARFRGSVYVPTTGDYTFFLTSDDASYLWLDNAARVSPPVTAQAAINNGGEHGLIVLARVVTLTAGMHDLLVHYGENFGANRLTLAYSGPGIPLQTVGNTSLCTASTGAPLPVELVRFEAKPVGTSVLVSWHTAQERNSAYFVVERSANGIVFEPAGQVAGAGTTTRPQAYQLTDRAPLPGLSYYRLHQIDSDGQNAYSPVVAVTSSPRVGLPEVAVFPNPNQGAFSVRVRQPSAEPAQLLLLDLRGQTVFRQTLPAAASADYTIVPERLPTGIYWLRLTTRAGTATQQVVIQR
ncbi:PA14 domain-containing protein [Hymenobacter algoricola]